jgi:hypothetical protein
VKLERVEFHDQGRQRDLDWALIGKLCRQDTEISMLTAITDSAGDDWG